MLSVAIVHALEQPALHVSPLTHRRVQTVPIRERSDAQEPKSTVRRASASRPGRRKP